MKTITRDRSAVAVAKTGGSDEWADGRCGIGLFRSKIGSRGSVGEVALVRSEALTCRMLLACTALHLCAPMMQKLLRLTSSSSDLLITFGARPERQKMADRGAGDPLWKQHLDGAQR